MKFPAIIKTVSIFMLLLFSLLLKNCTPDLYKGLFESESDVFNKRKKEHVKEGMTCAMPFLLLQIHLLPPKNNSYYLSNKQFASFVQKNVLRLKAIVFILKVHSEYSSTVNWRPKTS